MNQRVEGVKGVRRVRWDPGGLFVIMRFRTAKRRWSCFCTDIGGNIRRLHSDDRAFQTNHILFWSTRRNRRRTLVSPSVMWNVVLVWESPPTDVLPFFFKTFKPLLVLRLAHSVFSVCLVKRLLCLCKLFRKFAAKCNTHTHTHARTITRTRAHTRARVVSSRSFIVSLSLNQRTACVHSHTSSCSSTTNAHSAIGANDNSVPSEQAGVLFEKFAFFFETCLLLFNNSFYYSLI